MFREEFDRQAGTAKTKIEMLSKNPIGYFALAVLAGIYIGFGVILAFTIGGLLGGAAWTKIAMGLAFGIALSLVVIAGAELFTGNNLVMAAGMLKKEVSISAAVKLWAVCYLGDWLGALIISVMYHFYGSGIRAGGRVYGFFGGGKDVCVFRAAASARYTV